MKDKFLAYIEKLQPILEKIKPWLKTKKAWVQIGLSLVAIVCLIMAGVSSCSRRNDIIEIVDATAEPTAESTEKATATPETTATPVATETPVTATPEATENASSDVSASQDEPTAPEHTITNKSDPGPTGAPLYTQVPVESVDTKKEAYRTVIESCWGNKDYSSYCLYDMDSDGIEELILHYGTDDMQAYIDIYTFTEEGLIFVGDVTGSFASVAGDSNGGIIVYYRRDINGQCYESIDCLKKIGADIMVSPQVVSEKVDTYTVLESNVDITSYKLTDFSPLS